MKQIFKTLVLVAAAVATLTSCEKAPEVTPAAEEFTLTVNATLPAPDGTKTYIGEFDGTKYPVLWSEGDKIRVSQVPYVKTGDVYANSSGNMASANSKSMERFAENTKATFTLDNFSNDPGDDANHFDYLAIYGGSDYDVNKRSESQVYFAVTLPATQSPTAGQFDPNAALMGAMVESTTQQTSLNLDFNHLAAYAMLNVKNLDCGTETVESVTITSGEHKIAGAANWYYLEDTKLTPRSSSNAVQSITVDMKGQTLTNTNFEVYFTAIPTQFEEGDSLTFVVTTDKKKYTKSVEVTEETVFAFVQGSILDFSVDFGAGEITTESVTKEKYVLVTSVGDLAVDKEHEIILVAKNSENKYLTAQATASFSKKYNSIEINDVDGAFTLADDSSVEIFTLVFEAEKGWKLQCKNGKFLCYSSSTNFAQNTSVTDNKGYWTIAASVVEGATNKFTIANYSSDDRWIIFRFGTTNQFGAYSKSNASNAEYTEPYIYKKVTE